MSSERFIVTTGSLCVHCPLDVVPGCSDDQKPNSILAGNDIGSYRTSIARQFASNKIYCLSQKN